MLRLKITRQRAIDFNARKEFWPWLLACSVLHNRGLYKAVRRLNDIAIPAEVDGVCRYDWLWLVLVIEGYWTPWEAQVLLGDRTLLRDLGCEVR